MWRHRQWCVCLPLHCFHSNKQWRSLFVNTQSQKNIFNLAKGSRWVPAFREIASFLWAHLQISLSVSASVPAADPQAPTYYLPLWGCSECHITFISQTHATGFVTNVLTGQGGGELHIRFCLFHTQVVWLNIKKFFSTLSRFDILALLSLSMRLCCCSIWLTSIQHG